MFNSSDVRTILCANKSFSNLIQKNFVPSKKLKKLLKIIIPNIKNSELESLSSVNSVLQQAYFPSNGKFVYKIWNPESPFLTFSDSTLQWVINRMLEEYELYELRFFPDVALIMGCNLSNFCKQVAFLLSQMQKTKIYIPEIAILGSNRYITESERALFETLGFESENEIITEFDFMNAIISSRKNVNTLLLRTSSLPDNLKAYENIRHIVKVNALHDETRTYDNAIKKYVLDSNVENTKTLLVSSQPFCDYQLLVTLNAFLKTGTIPKKLDCIGCGAEEFESKLFGIHIAKFISTLVDICNFANITIS